MEGGRRRPMLREQMSMQERDSSKLRELLKVRDEEDQEPEPEAEGAGGNFESVPSRTLLDIIRDEGGSDGAAPGSPTHRINWKSFKDRLRIRRTGAAWADSSNSMSVSADFLHTLPQPAPSGEVPGAAAGSGEPAGPSEVAEPAPVRVSLMALLEQTDRHAGPLGGASDSASEGEGEEDEEEEDGGQGGEYACCVCMVRHKGAAFIPCGHTFCRLCSRELWVSRGNCPLCNGYILEILDIF